MGVVVAWSDSKKLRRKKAFQMKRLCLRRISLKIRSGSLKSYYWASCWVDFLELSKPSFRVMSCCIVGRQIHMIAILHSMMAQS